MTLDNNVKYLLIAKGKFNLQKGFGSLNLKGSKDVIAPYEVSSGISIQLTLDNNAVIQSMKMNALGQKVSSTEAIAPNN